MNVINEMSLKKSFYNTKNKINYKYAGLKSTYFNKETNVR